MSAAVYATVADIEILGRPLTASEQDRAPAMLEIASALLRREAKDRGRDLDVMIADDPDLGLIAKNVTVRSVVRSLDAVAAGTQNGSAAVSQESQSALGYSASFTYVNAGQALYFLRNELKDLGLMKQTYGAVEVYDVDQGN